MSAGTTGMQPHTNNEKNSRVDNSEPRSQPESNPPELTPDLPPQAVQGGEGDRKPKRPRGFAAMDRTVVSEIARKGGKAAHSAGTAHEFTSEEARVAGRKGGRATHAKRRRLTEDQEGKAQHEK